MEYNNEPNEEAIVNLISISILITIIIFIYQLTNN